MTIRQRLKPLWVRLAVLLAVLGPGLITASADNDAPGIATYSMAGSTYGYRFLWVIVVITVGEIIVMEMAGRMGAVTGQGTADLIREQFGVRVTTFAMVCLLIANLGTTMGEFAGIAAGVELFGISRYVAVPLAALLIGLLVIRGSYHHVEKVLLALSLAALSYIVAAFVQHPNWNEILHQATTPTFQGGADYLFTLLAVVGTTITPWGIVYMQASVADKGVPVAEYRYTRLDVVVGSAWGNVVSAFIVICTAATLFAAGIRVETAEQAAMALEPLAGVWARWLFAVGLLAASLLAAAVLPLSTAYAISEAFGWERGLDRPVRQARIFYGLYAGIIGLSVATVLIPGIPLFPLMWFSQSVNAILLPVLLILVLKLANDRRLMGRWTNPRWQNVLAWALTGLILLATVLLLAAPFS